MENPDGIYTDEGINPTIQRRLKISENTTLAWPFLREENAYFFIQDAEVTINDLVFTTSHGHMRDSENDLITVKIPQPGGCVVITPGDKVPEQLLLSIVAPGVLINDIPDGKEGTAVKLSAILQNGLFDEIDFKWVVNAGSLDDDTLPQPTLIRPSVNMDETFTVGLTVTAKGTGARYREGEISVEALPKTFIVEDVPVVAPVSPRIRVRFTTSTIIRFQWERVEGATYYVYRIEPGFGVDANSPWLRTTSLLRTIGGLRPASAYTFQLRAGNSGGVSDIDETTAITSFRRGAPQIALKNLRIEDVTDTTMAWTWDEDAESTFYEYRFIEGFEIPAEQEWVRIQDNKVEFIGLTPETLYAFEVRAGNEEGFGGAIGGLGFTEAGLPDIILPTLTINAIETGNEGEIVQLSAVVEDGAYDSIDYQWIVTGGQLDDDTSPTPTLTRPTVDEDIEYTASLVVLVEGLGQEYKVSSGLVVAEDVTYDVISIPETLPLPPENLRETGIGVNFILWEWDVVSNADYYEYRVAEGRTISPVVTWNRTTETDALLEVLDPETLYTIEVRSVNSLGNSAPARDSAQTSTGPVPSAPEINSAFTTTTIRWSFVNVGVPQDFFEYRFAAGNNVPDVEVWTRARSDFFMAENLSAESNYTIEVRAVNANGFGPVNKDTVLTAKNAPVTAPQNLRASNITTTTIRWDWDAVEGADFYEYRFSRGERLLDPIVLETTELFVEYDGLSAGVEYSFSVRGVNNGGLGPGPLLNVVRTVKPLPVANLRKTADTITSITWSWDAVVGAEFYDVRWAEGEYTTIPDNLSFVQQGGGRTSDITFTSNAILKINTPYTIEVIASAGGTPSLPFTITSYPEVVPAPERPRNLRETFSSFEAITWEWDGTADTDYYEYRIKEGVATFTNADAWIRVDEEFVELTGLNEQTTYTMQVRSVNVGGASLPTVDTGRTRTAPLSPPVFNEPTTLFDSISWTWGAVANAELYEYRFAAGSSIPPGQEWLTIAFPSLTFTGLNSDSEYTLEVRGTNQELGAGMIGRSRAYTIQFTAPQVTTSNLDNSANASTGLADVTFTWDNQLVTFDSRVNTYEYRFALGSTVPDNTPWSRDNIVNSSTTRSVTLNILQDEEYTFEVRGVLTAGESYKARATFKTEYSRSLVPTNLRLINVTNTTATVSWDAVPNAVSYAARTDRDVAGGIAVNDYENPTYTFTGLTQGQRTELSILSIGREGYSNTSASIFATPGRQSFLQSPPIAPPIIRISEVPPLRFPGIVWVEVNGAASYEYRFAEGLSVPDNTDWIATTVLFAGITSAVINTQYTIEVRALASDGTAGNVSTVTLFYGVNNLPAPEVIYSYYDDDITGGEIDLSFSHVEGAISYQYRLNGGAWTNTLSSRFFTNLRLPAPRNISNIVEIRALDRGGMAGDILTIDKTITAPVIHLQTINDRNTYLLWRTADSTRFTLFRYRIAEGSFVPDSTPWIAQRIQSFEATPLPRNTRSLTRGTQYTVEIEAIGSTNQRKTITFTTSPEE